ncbi:MAG: hypothetical protein NW201_03595 [Gemmatimonadales bacterium]|nr:hypothetical protein [Gemmatimonadales bacterium]
MLRGPAEVVGAACPAGALVRRDFLAADHDATVLDAPNALRLDRDTTGHLAFGSGPHRCLGAYLAPVQARPFPHVLLERVPVLVRAGEPVPEWEQVGETRVPGAFRRLPLFAA